MNNEINIIDAYNAVIEDIAQDIGYAAGAQETALGVLKGRLYELQNIWLIKANAEGDN